MESVSNGNVPVFVLPGVRDKIPVLAKHEYFVAMLWECKIIFAAVSIASDLLAKSVVPAVRRFAVSIAVYIRSDET